MPYSGNIGPEEGWWPMVWMTLLALFPIWGILLPLGVLLKLGIIQ